MTPTATVETAPSSTERGEERPAPRRESRAALLLLAVALAACSLVYELLAAQTLSLLAANTVTWYSLTVGVYLGAMGVGAFLSARVLKDRCPWKTLFQVEMVLTVAGVCIVPVLHWGHQVFTWAWQQEHVWTAYLAFHGTAFTMVAGVGILTGLELPILIGAAREAGFPDDSRHLVLGADYVGSLVGGVLFPMVLLPHWGLFSLGATVAGVNLAAAAWILVARLEPRGSGKSAFWGVATVGLLLTGFNLSAAVVEQQFLGKFYYARQAGVALWDHLRPRTDLPRVLRVRSPYQHIDLVKDIDPDYTSGLMPVYSRKWEREPDYPRNWVLFLNGDFQTNTTFDEIYHEYFAHVPIVAARQAPREVLLLGGGDGLLLREILRYPDVERVVHVDIDPVLPDLARTNGILSRANDGSFDDPRVERVRADGFQWVRSGTSKFDAAYVDFPVPVDFDLSRLYSREFFHFLARRLRPDGWAVFDATGIGLLTPPEGEVPQELIELNDWPVYRDTVRAAGWKTLVPYLTTLDHELDAAREVLMNADWTSLRNTRVGRALRRAEGEEEREEVKEEFISSLLSTHVYMLQQGFILMAPGEREFSRTWSDPGVTLDLLDGPNYERAFEVPFPFPQAIDPDLINSIFRPVFPTGSPWMPRQPL